MKPRQLATKGVSKAGQINEYQKEYKGHNTKLDKEAYLAVHKIYHEGFKKFSTRRFLAASPERAAEMVNRHLRGE